MLFYIKMDIGGIFATGIRFVIGFLVEAEDTGEDVIREGFNFEVVLLYGVVEIATGDIDPVFRAANVRLEVLELLRSLKVGVSFGNGHQPAKRTLELALGALVGGERIGIIDVYGDAGSFRAGGDDIFKCRFFEIGGPFDDFDDAVVEIGAALIIGFDITPGGFDALVGCHQSVVPGASAATKK